MSIVEEISTCLIRATTHTRTQIDLTPWDLQTLLIHYNQRGLLFHKPENHKYSPETTINHLKTTFSLTLDFFPLLAGRLVTSKEDGKQSFCIDCNNEGALFTSAIARDVKESDILEPKHEPKGTLSGFFPLNGVPNFEGTSNPLLAVQLTELHDGYFIACSINHSVADGTSFWYFMKSWAEISRGMDYPSKLPSFQRWFPEGVGPPIHIPLINKEAISNGKSIDIPKTNALWEDQFFHFSKENILKLKLKASPGMDSGNATRVSSLQAILAYIWRSVTRCRGLDENQETAMKMPAGARQRLHPPLPGGYFGNCVSLMVFTTMAGNLLSCDGLSWAAAQLNRVVASQTNEETKNFYKNWAKQPRLMKNADPNMSHNFLVMSSSQRFDVYGIDFGWGKPVAVRTGPNNKYDGKMAVFVGAEEGSIDVELTLSKDTMRALEKDLEFMEFVGEDQKDF